MQGMHMRAKSCIVSKASHWDNILARLSSKGHLNEEHVMKRKNIDIYKHVWNWM